MMIHTLVRGQKIDVTKESSRDERVTGRFNLECPDEYGCRCISFLVGFNGEITKEEDFVFMDNLILVVDLFN